MAISEAYSAYPYPLILTFSSSLVSDSSLALLWSVSEDVGVKATADATTLASIGVRKCEPLLLKSVKDGVGDVETSGVIESGVRDRVSSVMLISLRDGVGDVELSTMVEYEGDSSVFVTVVEELL